MSIEDQERPYTPFQRRSMIFDIMEKRNVPIGKAEELFSTELYVNQAKTLKTLSQFPSVPSNKNIS